MKLNTLLLSSAAVLVAGPALAADLPSKKAAPASAVTACKVGDMNGFTLPGSDTCLQISGRVTVDFQNSDFDDKDYFSTNSIFGPNGGPGYRLNFDARSNSEVGVVRSFVSLTGSDTVARKAFVQVGGFTAGLKDSIADIAGTEGNLFGSGWSQPSQGIDYQADIGALHVGVEVGDALVGSGDKPDVIGHLSGKFGSAGFALAAAMADSATDSGTAILGSVNVSAGPAKFYIWGGIADKASSKYITSTGNVDDARSIGAGVTFKVAAATSVSVQAVHWEGAGNVEQNNYGIYLSHALTKNLTLQPEVLVTDGNVVAAGGDSTQALLRIQRDF